MSNKKRQYYRNNRENERLDQKKRSEFKSVSTNVVKNKEDNTTSKKDNSFEEKKIGIPAINLFKKNIQQQNQPQQRRIIITNKNKNQQQEKPKQNRVIRNIIPYKVNILETTVCPICKKNISSMSSSITHRETGKPAHFECIYNELKKGLLLKNNQRLSYIGSGMFAIIEDVKDDGKNKFKIRERIQYERKSEVKLQK